MKACPNCILKIVSIAFLLLPIGTSALNAGDGSSAGSPIVITDDDASSFLENNMFVFDDGLYYRIDTAVTLDPQRVAVLGSTSAQNHMTIIGSAASFEAGNFIIGNEKNSGDWLTLANGAKASFTKLYVGNADSTAVVNIDSASLTVSGNPGTLSVGSIGRGIVNISGSGSLTTNESSVIIGSQWDSGFGNITISGGGTMTNTATNKSIHLGCSDCVASSFTVTGTGSAWIANEPVLIGEYGDASQLTVADSGLAVFAATPTVGSAACIVLDGGYLAIKSDAVLSDEAIIALNLCTVKDDAVTHFTADNLAMMKLMKVLSVTYYDGTKNAFSGSPIYDSCTTKGIDLTGYTVIYALAVGSSRAAPTTENDLVLCVDDGTTEKPCVYNTASSETWTNVYAGYSNLNNFMTVSGGTFTSTEAQIAVESGSSGSLTVTGASTIWSTTGTLIDGVIGTARLCVYKGATVSAANVLIGKGGSGTCLVSDSGSLLTTGTLSIGGNGSGTLKILSGALVAAETLTCNRGAVQLDGGYLAVKSWGVLDAAAIGAMHLYYFDGSSFEAITAKNLAALVAAGLVKVTYYTPGNYAAGDRLHDTYSVRGVNLAGYTVIHAGLSNMNWADNGAFDNGWFSSAWYGQYYAGTDYNGWIWSVTNGWQYVSMSGADGVVVWDAAAGIWCYTGRYLYPSLYDYSTGGWYCYIDGTAPNRRFWSWKDNSYITR